MIIRQLLFGGASSTNYHRRSKRSRAPKRRETYTRATSTTTNASVNARSGPANSWARTASALSELQVASCCSLGTAATYAMPCSRFFRQALDSQLLGSGDLPSVKIDRTRLVRGSDLRQYVESLRPVA
jgi:hypothetical protein